MEIILIKRDHALIPANDIEAEKLNHWQAGTPLKVKVTKPRNYEFHKKWFALVQLAYESWEPKPLEPDKFKGVAPEKNFDQFRKDLTILAGYYTATYRLDGSTRIEAKSISFGSMNEYEFAELYSSTVDVILKRVLTTYTKEDLDRVIGEILNGFA
jgi:hypothetical protein